MFSERNPQLRRLAALLALALAGAANASQPMLGQSGQSSPPGDLVDRNGYLQSELDWRSYYLNRPQAQRPLSRQAPETRHSVPTGDTGVTGSW
jgi:hypothetical protein